MNKYAFAGFVIWAFFGQYTSQAQSSYTELTPSPSGFQLTVSNTSSPYTVAGQWDVFAGNKTDVAHGLNIVTTNNFPVNFSLGNAYRFRMTETGELGIGADLVNTRTMRGLLHAYGKPTNAFNYNAFLTLPDFKSAVFGQAVSDATDGGHRLTGVLGSTNGNGGGNIGLMGIGSTNTSVAGDVFGVYGDSKIGSQAYSSFGVYGSAENTGQSNFWNAYGAYFIANGTNKSYGIYATSSGSGADKKAGYFNGDVQVTGTLSKGGGSFKIDHPLDPENKYLSHSFVESPDMMNVYNGNVVTDATGTATVQLPAYFESLNRDFRYQLTCIGTFAQAIVSKKVSGNTFEIKTDKPNVEVSWQVTGIRQDPWANAHRIPNEEEKSAKEKGKYLYPALYNKAQSQAVTPDPRGAEASNPNFKGIPDLPPAPKNTRQK
jgi:hypothetical protein